MINYIKYNSARANKYKLVTTIDFENGTSYKKAANDEGKHFLFNILDSYKSLHLANLPMSVVKPKKEEESIKFPFVRGDSLDAQLFRAVLEKNPNKIRKVFESYKSLILRTNLIQTSLGGEFAGVFGEPQKGKVPCLPVGCLDLILDNILVVKNEFVLIDYEWFFHFPVPVKYVFFRTIINAYYKYGDYDISSQLPLEEILLFFDITPEEEKHFLNYEYSFQNMVHEGGIGDKDSYVLRYKEGGRPRMRDSLDKIGHEKERLSLLVNELSREVSDKQAELEAIKKTRTWRLRTLVAKSKRKIGGENS